MKQESAHAKAQSLDRLKLFVAVGLTILLAIFVSQTISERPLDAKIAEEAKPEITATDDPLLQQPPPPSAPPTAAPAPQGAVPDEPARTADPSVTAVSPETGSATVILGTIEVPTSPVEASPEKITSSSSTPVISDAEPPSISVGSPAAASHEATTETLSEQPKEDAPQIPEVEFVPPLDGPRPTATTRMSADDATASPKTARIEPLLPPDSTPSTVSHATDSADEGQPAPATIGLPEAVTAVPSQDFVASEPDHLAAPHDPTNEANAEHAEEDTRESGPSPSEDPSQTSTTRTDTAPKPTPVEPEAGTTDAQPTPAEAVLPMSPTDSATPDLPLDTPLVSAKPLEPSAPIKLVEPSPPSTDASTPEEPSSVSIPTETTVPEPTGLPQPPSPGGLLREPSPSQAPRVLDDASSSSPTSQMAATRSYQIRSWGLLALGNHAAWVGRIPEAIAAYRASATVNPRNAIALRHLGDLYLYILRNPNLASYAYAAAIERLRAAGQFRAAAYLLWRVTRQHPRLTMELYARLHGSYPEFRNHTTEARRNDSS